MPNISKNSGSQGEWTTIIRPRTGWFDIDLRELWRYRDLIIMFVKRNFAVLYKQTILGPAWVLLNPLLTTVLFNVVFGGIAGLSTDGTPSFLFYMAGNTVWTFFSTCINNTANTFVANSQVFGKVYFPRLTTPISQVLTSLINFLIQAAMFVIFWLYFWLTGAQMHLTVWMWAVPVVGLQVMLLGLGTGAGRGHHCLQPDHQVPGPGHCGQLRRAAVDVHFPCGLSAVHPGQQPPAGISDAAESHDGAGGDLPHRHIGHRLGRHRHVCLQPGVYRGGAVHRRDSLQPD